ncbi:hypothetical protein V8P49_14050 [Acinetobacter baumannii]
MSEQNKNSDDYDRYYNELESVFESLRAFTRKIELKKEGDIKVKHYINSMDSSFSDILEAYKDVVEFDDTTLISIGASIIYLRDKINDFQLSEEERYYEYLSIIQGNLYTILSLIQKVRRLYELEDFNIKADNIISELKDKNKNLEEMISNNLILNQDLKNKKVHEIFSDDSENFKKLAKRYETAFYIVLALLFLYFFGWYIEVNTNNFKFKLAEQFYENHSAIFYIQKISLLVLSTTLAAFLLKRSFMNRRLADEAYRTAKELDALPRYMEGMPEEMKEKIRFDLTYKYFGNGIHHESYTGGENLMHENIKANTDFIKAVKDLKTPDSGKADSQGK